MIKSMNEKMKNALKKFGINISFNGSMQIKNQKPLTTKTVH